MSNNNEEYIASGTKVGSWLKGRIVSPEDEERWEKQRKERKKKRVKLDPHRY